MSTQETKEFGKWRSFLWPVHSYELKKVLPMFFMLFCINFNYTVLRDMKDAIVVKSSTAGAAIIPFLKLWCVVPAAAIFMMLYIKMANVLKKQTLFYATLAPFLIFFALYASVLSPNAELLHPTTSADWLASILPAGWGGFVAVYQNWIHALFYISAELWGSVALSLLFWGFANDITRVSESKRFYSLFLLGAQFAMLVSGPLITQIASVDADNWAFALNWLMGIVVVMGLGVMGLYRYVNASVLTDTRFYDPKDVKKKKKKAKMGLFASLKYLGTSPYLLALAFLVLAYGMSINLIEVIWKQQLNMLYPTKNEYLAFMGKFSFFTGLSTLLLLVFVSGNVVRKFGWGVAASVTPTVLLITGIAFFAFILFKDSTTALTAMFGTTPLVAAVLIGATQNIMSKSSKYSLFDPTKEMAYIPLDDEVKAKGKAAIDGVGGRLGKSGGATIYQILLVMFPTLTALTPYVAAIVMGIVACWLLSVRFLNGQFNKLTAEHEAAQAAIEAEEKKETVKEGKLAGATA